MAMTAFTPGHHLGAHPGSQLRVQLVLVKCSISAQRVLRRLGHVRRRLTWCKSLLGRQPLNLPAELDAQLVV